MGKGRIEAFSDGVLAVIITIMVLELHVPEGHDLSALWVVYPRFLSYVLSFIFIGIYWNNHHNLFHSISHVNGSVMWANNFLLFWLSLVPFATDWMGETHFETMPAVVYGLVLLMCGIAYYIVVLALRKLHGPESAVSLALGTDWKGIVSPVLYILGILSALFIHPYVACGIYALVAAMWFVPDRRFTRQIDHKA